VEENKKTLLKHKLEKSYIKTILKHNFSGYFYQQAWLAVLDYSNSQIISLETGLPAKKDGKSSTSLIYPAMNKH